MDGPLNLHNVLLTQATGLFAQLGGRALIHGDLAQASSVTGGQEHDASKVPVGVDPSLEDRGLRGVFDTECPAPVSALGIFEHVVSQQVQKRLTNRAGGETRPVWMLFVEAYSATSKPLVQSGSRESMYPSKSSSKLLLHSYEEL